MKLIGRCGQQADACVMSLAEFQKAPPGTPAILAAAPVDFAQADAWIRSGAERILLEGDRLGDGELIHELAVGLGRNRVAVRIPVAMRGGVLSLAEDGANIVGSDRVLDWARMSERRWGDELWLDPAEGLDEGLLEALRQVAGAVRVRLVLCCAGSADWRRLAREGYLGGLYAPDELEAARQAAQQETEGETQAFDPTVIRWDSRGLVPVIAQDAATDRVLMLAYMNREALEQTMALGEMVYYSRSRQQLWHKGATSGHFQRVHSLWYDCDADTLLARVEQIGAACHTGSFSCFTHPIVDYGEPAGYREIVREMEGILERKARPQSGSYTNKLLERGVDKICKKVAEEACEVVLAAKNGNPQELTYESCDLLYHLFVLLAQQGVSLAGICQELEARRKK